MKRHNKIISLALVLMLMATSTFSMNVSADSNSGISLDRIVKDVGTILENKHENTMIIVNLTADLIKATLAKYKDVKDTDWFKEDVALLTSTKVMEGLPDGKFNPLGLMTRAEFTKVVVLAKGYSLENAVAFNDTKGHWSQNYVSTAVKQGIISKEAYGQDFKPNQPITRQEAMLMMGNALSQELANEDRTATYDSLNVLVKNPYMDMGAGNEMATKLYKAYLMRGFTEGGKQYFKPDKTLSRAEGAKIIVNMLKYSKNPEGYKIDQLKADLDKRIKNGQGVTLVLKNWGSAIVTVEGTPLQTWYGKLPYHSSWTVDGNGEWHIKILNKKYNQAEDYPIARFVELQDAK